MASWSGFWGDGQGSNGSYELLSGRSPNRYHLARLFRKKGMREVGEFIFTALADNTPSDTMSVQVSQLTAAADTGNNVQGGVRTIAAQELVGLVLDSDKDDASANTSRASGAADVTTINAEIIPSGTRAQRTPTFANMTDLSGNGGGGKLS